MFMKLMRPLLPSFELPLGMLLGRERHVINIHRSTDDVRPLWHGVEPSATSTLFAIHATRIACASGLIALVS